MAVLDWLQQLLGGGDPEAEGAVASSQAMQPMTGPWLDKVLSGEMARQGIQDVNDAFASRDPVALAGSFGPSPLGIRAFHGSPHSFDQFDLSKIGTGEGAQAYGHGLYFAESEPVARQYRDALAAKPAGVSDAMNDAAQYWLKEHGGDSAAAAKAYLDYAGPQADPKLAAYIAKPPGHMYEVDINAKPEDFLQWDKPLGDSPAAIEALKTHGGFTDVGRNTLISRMGHMAKPDDPFERVYQDLGASLKDPSSNVWNYPAATKVFSEAGIPGIRYLDQGSRGAGQGSSNYVVFNDNLIQILRKYGLLPPLAAGGLLAAQPGEAGQP